MHRFPSAGGGQPDQQVRPLHNAGINFIQQQPTHLPPRAPHFEMVSNAAHFGLVGGYPKPTTALSYPPFLSTKPSETGRDADHNKKRPSLLSDFHLTNATAAAMHISSSMIDKSSSLSNVKESASKHDLAARRSLQLDVPTYAPQVENISPTPDDQTNFSGTDKDGISDRIQKVDKEIMMVEEKVKKLLKKKQELEESSTGVDEILPLISSTAVAVEPKNETLFEKIYAENRKKAASARSKLAHLNPPTRITPVYQQPWDTKLFDGLRKKHEEFRPRLILYLKRMHREQQIREKYLTEKYNQQMQEWKKKMERFERHPKRIAKEQRNREIFEKTFPELKKQREERERSMRQVDGRSSMLGQGDQPYDTVCVQEEEEIMKMRQNAVLPPMMYDERTRKRMRYVNNNNLVRDPAGEHQSRLDFFKIIWSDDEKRMFREKFLQYGKNFAAIATFLDRKTTKDCVQYYYLTKKRENYKQMMRRPYRRRGKPYKPPLMPRVDDSCKEFADGNDPDASLSVASEDVTPCETEYFCIDCKCKIDVNNPGRVLTRSCYEQYGLDPSDPASQEVRICLKCRLGSVRRRFSQCPIGTCNSVKRRVKPRVFPAKWFELTVEQRKFVAAEFQIIDDTNRCCGSCYKRLHRRLETMPGTVGDSSSTDSSMLKQETWKDDDVNRLKEAVSTLGTNSWDAVAVQISGKTADECKQFYSGQEKSLSTESKRTKVVGQVPGIEEEEEEDDAGNSDDEENIPSSSVDTSRVPSPKIQSASIKLDGPGPLPLVESNLVIDEENSERKRRFAFDSQAADDESSATLSADEGQNDIMMMDAANSTDVEMKMDKKYMKVERAQTPKDSMAQQRVGAVLPENLPACQPYKLKSRQIQRVEEENRIAAAIAAAATVTPFSRPTPAQIGVPSTTKPNLLQQVQPLSSVTLSPASKILPPASSAGDQQTFAPYSQAGGEPFGRPTESIPAESRDTESPMVVKVISRNKPGVDSLAQSPLPKIGAGQTGSGQQQEASVRGSLTKGTPVLPYIIGGDPSGQQKILDMSKMFRPPPSKSEETNRAASADTLKETRCTPTDPSRSTPSGNGREQQQQQQAQHAAAAAAFPGHQRGPRMSYEQLAMFRQQNTYQMLQSQTAAALFSQLLGAAPNSAAQLYDYHTAMQKSGGSTSGQQQQQQQSSNELLVLEAQNALFQSQQRAAFEQQQQHFIAEQQRRHEQQFFAEQNLQKRILMMTEIEKIRFFEHYREQFQQQQKQADRSAELSYRPQQQLQQQPGDALRTAELAFRQQQLLAEAIRSREREREMLNECGRTPSEQKILEAQQSIRSPSTGSSGRQSAAVTSASTAQQQQQQLSQQMLEALLHQHMIKVGMHPQHLNLQAMQQHVVAFQQQQQQQQHQQQQQQQVTPAAAAAVHQQQMQQQIKNAVQVQSHQRMPSIPQQHQRQQQVHEQQQKQTQQTPLQQRQALMQFQQSLQLVQQSHIQQRTQQSPHQQQQQQQQQTSSSRTSSVQRASPVVIQVPKSEPKERTSKSNESKPDKIFRTNENISTPPVTRQSIIHVGPPKPVTQHTKKEQPQQLDSCNIARTSVATGCQTVRPTKAAMKEFPPFIVKETPGRGLICPTDDSVSTNNHSSVSTPPMAANVPPAATTVIQQSSSTGSFFTPTVPSQPSFVPTVANVPATSHPLPTSASLTAVSTGLPFVSATNVPLLQPVATTSLAYPGLTHPGPRLAPMAYGFPVGQPIQKPHSPASINVPPQPRSISSTTSSSVQQPLIYPIASSVNQMPSFTAVSSGQQSVMFAPVSSIQQTISTPYSLSVPQSTTAEPLAATDISGRKISSVQSPKEVMTPNPIAVAKTPVVSAAPPLDTHGTVQQTMPDFITSMITKHHAEETVNENKIKPNEKPVDLPLTRPQQLPLKDPLQKLEKFSSSLSEVSPKPDPSFERLSIATAPSPKSCLEQSRKVVGSSPSSSSLGTSNIIKHIDEVIIGEIVQTKNRNVQQVPPTSQPQPVQQQALPIAEPQLEPVTPDSAPSNSIATFAFEMNEKQGMKHLPMKQMSSSFEYDLEPVSPPEQQQYDVTPLPPPVIAKPPPKPTPSSTTSWNISVRDISPDLSLSQNIITPSSVPPFMAFNVFTLPTVSSAPTTVATAPPPWTQTMSSSMAEDNESTRAVAALIETELQSDPGSNPYKSKESSIASSTAVMNLPIVTHYEPLSDDES